jgi:hypothetical protein
VGVAQNNVLRRRRHVTDGKKSLYFFGIFYLPHMEYEKSIGSVMRKIFFIADFHVLGLFMAKKHDFNDKKNSVCHAPLPYAKFVPRLQPRP